jgi:hypothetical protein
VHGGESPVVHLLKEIHVISALFLLRVKNFVQFTSKTLLKSIVEILNEIYADLKAMFLYDTFPEIGYIEENK